jgi:hypothetical protein
MHAVMHDAYSQLCAQLCTLFLLRPGVMSFMASLFDDGTPPEERMWAAFGNDDDIARDVDEVLGVTGVESLEDILAAI